MFRGLIRFIIPAMNRESGALERLNGAKGFATAPPDAVPGDVGEWLKPTLC